MKGKDKKSDHILKTSQYELVYKDESGDFINISDDEDLQAAYENAES